MALCSFAARAVRTSFTRSFATAASKLTPQQLELRIQNPKLFAASEELQAALTPEARAKAFSRALRNHDLNKAVAKEVTDFDATKVMPQDLAALTVTEEEVGKEEFAKIRTALKLPQSATSAVIESFTPEGKLWTQTLVEELSCMVASAAGTQEPLAYFRSLASAEFPTSAAEGHVMDVLVALHGRNRAIGQPLREQINVEYLKKFEPFLEATYKKEGFGQLLSNWKEERKEWEENSDMHEEGYNYQTAFLLGAPIVAGIVLYAYWDELHHVSHLKHEQHERVAKLLGEH